MTEIHKVAGYVPASSEMIEDLRSTVDGFLRWMAMTPEERERAALERAQERAAERSAQELSDQALGIVVLPDLEVVLDKLGWSNGYAVHLSQPYCECSWGMEGWDYCQHAYDLGLVGNDG